MTTLAPTRLRAAKVLRAHGVRGEVRAEPCGGDWSRFTPGLRLGVEGGTRTLAVRSARPAPGGLVLLAFDGVTTTHDAASLRGAYLCVDVDAARPLGDDEWFVWQLVGLHAVSPEGDAIGVVEDIEPAPGNDVLVLRDGDREMRLPMVRDYVLGVDLAAGTMTVARWSEEPA